MSTLRKAVALAISQGSTALVRGAAVSVLRKLSTASKQWAGSLEGKTIQESIRRSLTREHRDLIARNESLRNIHKGRRCFVIGNGPSLKSQDLSPLGKELTFVMSGFFKHPIVEQWQPSYYCLADPLFFDGSEPMTDFLRNVSRRIHASSFVFPLSGSRIVKEQGDLPWDRIYWVAGSGHPLEAWGRTNLDFTLGVPAVKSVSQLALMAALFMGCSPIYLLGLDHDWLAHRGLDRHFYEGKTVADHPVAHGDLDRQSYRAEAQSVLDLWSGYEVLDRIARAGGQAIYNATAGGFLDVFERANYSSLVET